MSDQAPQAKDGRGAPLTVPPDLAQPLHLHRETPPMLRGVEGEKQATAGEATLTFTEYHSKFAEEIHNYLREYIRNADQKASFFFAGATAIVAFLNSRGGGPARWIKDPRMWSLSDCLSFIAVMSLILSAGFLLSVVFPRLKGSRRGLIFFSAIAEYESGSDYAAEIARRPQNEIVCAKLQHSYDLSKVCVAKYKALRIGFWIGSIGGATALIYILAS
ncbi:MAG: Pycsar system effector family protein [Bryobacteraceae bacterium]